MLQSIVSICLQLLSSILILISSSNNAVSWCKFILHMAQSSTSSSLSLWLREKKISHVWFTNTLVSLFQHALWSPSLKKFNKQYLLQNAVVSQSSYCYLNASAAEWYHHGCMLWKLLNLGTGYIVLIHIMWNQQKWKQTSFLPHALTNLSTLSDLYKIMLTI